MKFALAFVLATISISASANTLKTDCNFQDFQLISSALRGPATMRLGAELKSSLVGLLSEEIGVKCDSVMDSNGMFGIPGNKFYNYEISGSGGRHYELAVVVGGVEQPGTFVSIKKK